MFTSPVSKTHFSTEGIYTHANISPQLGAEMVMPLRFYGLLQRRKQKGGGGTRTGVDFITPKHKKKVLKIAECTVVCSS